MKTPWGDTAELRGRRLPAGRGTPRRVAERNQRERLSAAMVACVSEKGFAATTLADLERVSGVSRKSFYELFASKDDCLLKAVEELVAMTAAGLASACEKVSGGGEGRVRAGLDALIGLIVAQPAAARMCLIEVHAGGPGALGPQEGAIASLEAWVGKELAGIWGREMPTELAGAIVGGLRIVIERRLRRGGEAELIELAPQLLQWSLELPPAPQPLRRRGRGNGKRAPARAKPNTEERLLRALGRTVSEKGYRETAVSDIVAAAATSQRTFYAHFDGKIEATLAALDQGSARMLAAILPAYRQAASWPEAVRAAIETMLTFGTSEPEFAELLTIDVYGAGGRALDQRDQVMEGLEALLAPGYELAPRTPPAVAGEVTCGAIYGLICEQIRAEGAEALPAIGAVATYVALAPFVGGERAAAVANGEE